MSQRRGREYNRKPDTDNEPQDYEPMTATAQADPPAAHQSPPVEPDITFKYVQRFQCIGAACEATCCAGWNINLSQADYETKKSKLSVTPEGKKLFNIGVNLKPENKRTLERYAQLKLTDGNCNFLDAGMCKAHRDFGEESLSYTCSTYPRRLSNVNGVRELSAMMSCPEIARQVLLHHDSMELVELEDSMLPRTAANVIVEETCGTLIATYYNDIRTILLSMLTNVDWPLSTRLLFMSFFSNRTSQYMDATTPDSQVHKLVETVDFLSKSDSYSLLASQFDDINPSLEPVVKLTNWLVNSAVSSIAVPGFRELIDEIKKISGATKDDEECRFDINIYLANKGRVTARAGGKIDEYFTLATLNYLANTPLIAVPNLNDYMQRLGLVRAVQKLLLFHHPRLLAALDIECDESFKNILDEVAVETVYLTSRAIEHSKLIPTLQKELKTLETEPFVANILLFKF